MFQVIIVDIRNNEKVAEGKLSENRWIENQYCLNIDSGYRIFLSADVIDRIVYENGYKKNE